MDAMQLGFQLFQEIEAVRTNGSWRWEKRISGPLTYSDVVMIANIAGCWSYEASADEGESVRFYANQNHPSHGGRP